MKGGASMDYNRNIGKKASDRATEISGAITGVWYAMCESPRYLLEYTDTQGCAQTLWAAVERVDLWPESNPA